LREQLLGGQEDLDPYSPRPSNAEKEKYASLVETAKGLRKQVENIETPILEALKNETASAIAWDKRFDHWSLVFYILGVFVSLVGQVVGNEGTTET
jgi:hypothetical protein